MGYKGIICPVCGSNLIKEVENGRLKCESCGVLIENESTYADTNAIMTYLDGSQFETAENYCRDALARTGSTPVLNWLLFLAKNKIHLSTTPKRVKESLFFIAKEYLSVIAYSTTKTIMRQFKASIRLNINVSANLSKR